MVDYGSLDNKGSETFSVRSFLCYRRGSWDSDTYHQGHCHCHVWVIQTWGLGKQHMGVQLWYRALDIRGSRQLTLEVPLSANCVIYSRAGDIFTRGSRKSDNPGTKGHTDQPATSFTLCRGFMSRGWQAWHAQGLGRNVVEWGSQASGNSPALCWGSLLVPVHRGLGSWQALAVCVPELWPQALYTAGRQHMAVIPTYHSTKDQDQEGWGTEGRRGTGVEAAATNMEYSWQLTTAS